MVALFSGLVSAAVFLMYAGAVRTYFRYEHMPLPMTILSALAIISFAALMVLLSLSEKYAGPIVIGTVLQVVGALLFLSAKRAASNGRLPIAFDPSTPTAIVTGGPYRWIRHPFYASYMLYWAGVAISCWSPYAVIPLAVLFPFYLYAAMSEERELAASPLAASYLMYKATTGFFIPRLKLLNRKQAGPE